MARKPKAPSKSASRQLYEQYIARLKKLGCTFCPTCYAWLMPGHDCRAFEPVYLPLPLEAYTFAADKEVA